MERRLILASGSPRRKTLLEKVGIEIQVVASRIEEASCGDEMASEHVRRLAEEKADNVAGRFLHRWVLGADTVVVIDDEILGKPETVREAKRMLSLLSGRDHSVLTGYAIVNKGDAVSASHVVETRVRVKDLSPEEIEWYIRTEEPFGKAGAYAIQGVGSFMIEEIEGSYTNVVGLPVCQVLESLRGLGAVELK